VDKQSVAHLTRAYHSAEVQEFLLEARRFKRVAMISGASALGVFALMTLCLVVMLLASVSPFESAGTKTFFGVGYGLFTVAAGVSWICSIRQARLTRRADAIFDLSLRSTAHKSAAETTAPDVAEAEPDDE
jgi:hypothetical protein